MKKENLITALKEIMEKETEILFAYLYGSYALNFIHSKSDIDIAVYLIPSNINDYIQKEKELSAAIITKLHIDNIDLRILNTLPFLLKYKVIKEGIPIIIKDEAERVDFETMIMNRFFELKPYLDEYNRMLFQRIKAGV